MDVFWQWKALQKVDERRSLVFCSILAAMCAENCEVGGFPSPNRRICCILAAMCTGNYCETKNSAPKSWYLQHSGICVCWKPLWNEDFRPRVVVFAALWQPPMPKTLEKRTSQNRLRNGRWVTLGAFSKKNCRSFKSLVRKTPKVTHLPFRNLFWHLCFSTFSGVKGCQNAANTRHRGGKMQFFHSFRR